MTAQSPSNNVLRYPYSRMNDNASDFLKIRILRYKAPGEEGNPFSGGFNLQSAFDRYGLQRESGFIDEQKTEVLQTILLPIPQSIQDSNGVRWGEDSLNSLASRGLKEAGAITTAGSVGGAITQAREAIEDLAKIGTGEQTRNLTNVFFGAQVVNALGGNTSFQSLVSRTTGQVLNPNLELLFNGVTLRSFSFDFDLVPREERESKEVRAIIRTLKKHMSAKGGSTGSVESGLFIKSPDIFFVQYVNGGEPHEYLNQFKPMALKNMSVNYTGSGTYATYENTSPVHYKMNLQFQEIDPIYAEDYDDIFSPSLPKGIGGPSLPEISVSDPNIDGVGY